MAEPVDAKVVGAGAALQVAVAVPLAILVKVLRQDDLGAESNLWPMAAFLALVVAPAAAGVLVGRRRPAAPLVHAAAATALGWAALTAVRLVRASVAADELAPILAALLSIAPIQVGVGVLGAFFSRPRPTSEEIDP
ncbi:MAG: hypothetical protein ABIS47_11080 [Acidimicrobiales bacterium]